MTPCWGNTFQYPFFQQLPRLCLKPLKVGRAKFFTWPTMRQSWASIRAILGYMTPNFGAYWASEIPSKCCYLSRVLSLTQIFGKSYGRLSPKIFAWPT